MSHLDYEDCQLGPCPRCGEMICLECENWRRHHSFRGWVGSYWQRYARRWWEVKRT